MDKASASMPTHYDYVGIEADRRIIVGRTLDKNNAQHWYIDSAGATTPYPYKRR
jgi:hypothetical protein